jgi:ATP-dependent DNA helicase DinG
MVETGSAVELLSDSGPFARELGNFVPRAQQQMLAQAIDEVISERGALIAEAGTGTGKTFAYLTPVLLHGVRSIISTGTKALQDQLFHRDLPRVRALVGSKARIALLKGRANYLCLHRLERMTVEMRFESREQVAEFSRIRTWAAKTRSGDRGECTNVSEGASIWSQVTSTPDNCLGRECPHFDSCYLVKARRNAMDADVVVVNHALLLADMSMRSGGFGEVLPGAQVLVIDEAHQLPESATQFFGQHFSGRQLIELVRDAKAEASKVTGAAKTLMDPAAELELANKKLRLAFEGFPVKGTLASVLHDGQIQSAIDALLLALRVFVGGLVALAESSVGLESCATRGTALIEHLETFGREASLTEVHWYELSQSGFVLHATPLDVADSLASMRMQSGATWIMTSATLAVGESFEHYKQQSGLIDAKTLQVGSPFDYQRQALRYLPRGLPEPNQPNYTAEVVRAALPALKASNGRAFLLFTSHRALNEAAALLRLEIDLPMFVQGTAPRSKLLSDFIASGNGVLLGAASFWEGVDVPGDALSLVVIDKLPFAQIGDPVMEARMQLIRERGGDPFNEYQLPSAALTLKQGAGRLIRTVEDRGVLMLCDPRLRTRRYGRVFLDALPPMSETAAIEDVELFFRMFEHS